MLKEFYGRCLNLMNTNATTDATTNDPFQYELDESTIYDYNYNELLKPKYWFYNPKTDECEHQVAFSISNERFYAKSDCEDVCTTSSSKFDIYF